MAGLFVWGLWEWVRRNCGSDSFVCTHVWQALALWDHLCLVIAALAMPRIKARHILASRYCVAAASLWDEEGVDVGCGSGSTIRGS